MNRPPVIIEAALNGGTAKARNPRVPRVIGEIVEDALACMDAGAAIVHNHHAEPVIGCPVHAAAPYREAYTRIRARVPAAILYPTMGGGAPGVTMAERYAHVATLAEAGHLRMGLVDPGSTNFAGRDPDGRPSASEAVYLNTYADTRYMIDGCARYGLGPSVAIFEPGFLRAALGYHAAGALPAGALVKLYFSGSFPGFGLPPTSPSLSAYLALLEGTGLPWSVAVLGGDVLTTIAEEAVRRGGHLRVGLEDYAGPGTSSNVELVHACADLVERFGCRPATVAEAGDLLGLPR